jgi:polyisoprenoid-binding protein YceI
MIMVDGKQYYNINIKKMEKELTKTKWGIDHAHSEIGFRVKHLMVANVRGIFTEFDASIYTSEKDFMSAEIDFWLNPWKDVSATTDHKRL